MHFTTSNECQEIKYSIFGGARYAKGDCNRIAFGRSLSNTAILTGFGCIFCSTSDQEYGLIIVLFTET